MSADKILQVFDTSESLDLRITGLISYMQSLIDITEEVFDELKPSEITESISVIDDVVQECLEYMIKLDEVAEPIYCKNKGAYIKINLDVINDDLKSIKRQIDRAKALLSKGNNKHTTKTLKQILEEIYKQHIKPLNNHFDNSYQIEIDKYLNQLRADNPVENCLLLMAKCLSDFSIMEESLLPIHIETLKKKCNTFFIKCWLKKIAIDNYDVEFDEKLKSLEIRLEELYSNGKQPNWIEGSIVVSMAKSFSDWLIKCASHIMVINQLEAGNSELAAKQTPAQSEHKQAEPVESATELKDLDIPLILVLERLCESPEVSQSARLWAGGKDEKDMRKRLNTLWEQGLVERKGKKYFKYKITPAGINAYKRNMHLLPKSPEPSNKK